MLQKTPAELKGTAVTPSTFPLVIWAVIVIIIIILIIVTFSKKL